MAASYNQSSEIALALNRNVESSSHSDAAAGPPDDEAVAADQPQDFRAKQVEQYFRYDRERDKASDVRTALLTVAVLMATTTYQAGLSPPGGVWQDNNDEVNPKQVAGVSILGTRNRCLFGMFMVGNTLGFYFSLYMIDFLTRGFPLRLELTVAIVALVVTYCSSMYTIVPLSQPLTLTFYVLSVVLPVSLPFIIPFLRDSKLARKIRC